MDAKECNERRIKAGDEITRILRSLEADTGMSVGSLSTEHMSSFQNPSRIAYVVVKLELT